MQQSNATSAKAIRTYLLLAAMLFTSLSSFAHRVELYGNTGCASGTTLTVNATVLFAPSTTYYNWQYKDNSGVWKFFTATSTINGTAFSVSGYQNGPVANNAGTLSIAGATTVLDNVQVRVLMSENVRPNGAPAGTQIWGGDDQALNEVKMFRLHVYSSPTDCGGTTPGCIGNLLVSGTSYYGGFESMVYSSSSSTFTNNNFAAAATDYTQGGNNTTIPATSGSGTYQILNNPFGMNTGNGKFAPHTGNFQMVIDGAANVQKKAWYKTVTVEPGAVYNFSVWVARAQGSNAFNLKLTANGTDIKSSAVSTTVGAWAQVAASYTVPLGVTSIVISISDVSATTERFYSLDDICFAKVTNAGSIGDRVWKDINMNGIQDAGETGISGVTVQLTTTSGTVLATTTTNGTGNYLFSGLAAGNYKVVFGAVAGSVRTTANVGSDDAVDSDPDVTTGATGAITLTAGQNNLTVDAGYYPTNLQLGNKVFYDTNNNGIDNTDNGIAGVTVNLYRDANNDNVADGAAIATLVTDVNGAYNFTNLTPGNYIVGAVAPAGYMSSAVNGGDPDNNIDLDDNGQVATSGNEVRGLGITLTANNTTYDFGFLPDCTCTTAAGNMLTNPSFENGTTGWTATGGTLTTGTGYIACGAANGFNNWSSGTSKVYQDVTTVPGAVLTFKGFAGIHTPGLACSPKLSMIFLNAAGTVLGQTDVAVTRDVDVNHAQLEQYTIVATAPALTAKVRIQSSTTCNTMKLDAFCLTAVNPSYTLGNTVWYDANNNGTLDAGETGMTGVVVKLYDAAGTYLNKTATTDANGNYQFTALSAGSYIVGITTPAGYTKSDVGTTAIGTDNQNDGVNIVTTEIRTNTFNLTASSNNIDFGLKATGAIGDFVFSDNNGNGIQDAGEAGIANVTVTLTAPGFATMTATTNASGIYSFINLPPNTYTVTFAAPAGSGLVATVANAGSDDTKDSDPISGAVTGVVLAAGQTNITIDAGFYHAVNLGNFVWFDKNANGLQDAGENGLGEVIVNLYKDANGDNVPDGASIAQTATNPSGNYNFANLVPGKYIVGINIPNGYKIGIATGTSATPDNDNNADNNGVNQVGTQLRSNTITLVAGAEPAVAIDGDDTNGNLTVDFGLLAIGSIGDFVWDDQNRNGIQDAGEPGIQGATVTLTYPDGTTSTATTNATGNYTFQNLTNGNYSVAFTTPSGYLVTATDAGSNDAVDSDPTGGTIAVSLGLGEMNTTIDAGFYRIISLSGNVWHDVNGMSDNLVNNSGAAQTPPAAHIPTGLRMVLVDANTGLVVDNALVLGDGTYNFPNVVPGDYILVLSKQAYAPGTLEPPSSVNSGWQYTGEHLGLDPGRDLVVNGKLAVQVQITDVSVTNANFGIRLTNGDGGID